MKTSSTLLGLIAGAVVGTAIGILIAPDKGENTRKKISEKSKLAKDKLKEGLDDFLDTVSEKYAHMKETGEEMLNKGENTLNKEKEAARERMNKA